MQMFFANCAVAPLKGGDIVATRAESKYVLWK
jgi:hypothetical protein